MASIHDVAIVAAQGFNMICSNGNQNAILDQFISLLNALNDCPIDYQEKAKKSTNLIVELFIEKFQENGLMVGRDIEAKYLNAIETNLITEDVRNSLKNLLE